MAGAAYFALTAQSTAPTIARVKCPSCGTNVADDAAVCQKCDHILDPSLFSDEPPADPPEPPARKPAARPKSAAARPAKAAAPARKAPSSASGKPVAPRRSMPEAPARKSRTPPEERAAVEDWHVAPSERAAPSSAGPGPSQALDPEEAMADARNFIVALSTPDKIAFWGAVATLVACFLPWKETVQEGEFIGLLSLGALVFGAHVALIGAIIIRVRRAMPSLNAMVPWLVQFGTSAFSIVWCLVLIKLAVNTLKARALYGNEEVWTSKPGLGVVLALLSSIVAFLGTLMGLREKNE